ncbi:hypothetical protein HC031_09035 [Planosporangium thailandense]|uniref:Uncharacterized protein n=1 Tax=Planosporangium thailandense TaxID=765197 RepID=A0ABX0XUZ8_9ACTN|nr:hypothetical protein [Planosporangium thailandense]NJC69861.1 hypothetical protein [Planosporangium thailandense]
MQRTATSKMTLSGAGPAASCPARVPYSIRDRYPPRVSYSRLVPLLAA